jgi:hypothetical protein
MVTPVRLLSRRAPEAGRIRLGVKTGRAMKAIDTFRFTSPHRESIERLASIYGGTPKPWDEPKARVKNQWEVITECKQGLRVFLPQDSLSLNYEAWSGGGRIRECDGEVCMISVRGPDAGLEPTPCICHAKGVQECSPKLRMQVILPELDFQGSWRLETGSWNAVHELPGMYEMIQQLASTGKMVDAYLNIEPRTQVKDGKTKNFVVPTLSMAHTPLNMLEGSSSVRPQLTAAPAPLDMEALPVAPDEVLEDDGQLVFLEEQVRAIADQHKIEQEAFIVHVFERTGGDLEKVRNMIHAVGNGTSVPGYGEDGEIKWAKP